MQAIPTPGANSTSTSSVLFGYRERDPKAPPICRRCQTSPVRLSNVAPDGDPAHWIALSPFCIPCAMAIKSEERQALQLASQEALRQHLREDWNVFGPEGEVNEDCIYRDCDFALLPCPNIAAKILEWKPSRKGMLIHGESGHGKTFMLYALARKLMFDHGVRPLLWTGPGFRLQVTAAARHSDGAKRGALIARMVNAPVLMIDDLGQAAASDAAEEALWEVVEGRTSRNRPCIVTTQFIGERFGTRFLKPETADAVIRRLSQYSETIRAFELPPK